MLILNSKLGKETEDRIQDLYKDQIFVGKDVEVVKADMKAKNVDESNAATKEERVETYSSILEVEFFQPFLL